MKDTYMLPQRLAVFDQKLFVTERLTGRFSAEKLLYLYSTQYPYSFFFFRNIFRHIVYINTIYYSYRNSTDYLVGFAVVWRRGAVYVFLFAKIGLYAQHNK